LARIIVQPNRQFIHNEKCHWIKLKRIARVEKDDVRVGMFFVFSDCFALSKLTKMTKKSKLAIIVPYEEVIRIKQNDNLLFIETQCIWTKKSDPNVLTFKILFSSESIIYAKYHLETSMLAHGEK